MEGLEWLDHLDGEPVTLVSDLADDHLVETLETSLSKDGQHTVVPDLKLVAIGLCELQLRLLLFVQTLVVLVEGAGLLLTLLGLLSGCMVA